MDWDQDGKLDILSGCYWTEGADAGHIQILKGKGELDFEKATALLNADGKPLENVKVDGDNSLQTLAICTQQHAVDYDGDGDLDLVVGCFGNKFYLYENKADEENGEASLVATPVELPIESPSYHSAPHLADWDADGDLDLLTGSGDGGVLISENTGTRKKPEWSEFKQLVDYAAGRQQSPSADKPLEMSPSTRVWTTDFNSDGFLDLLIGDSANISKSVEGKTAEECRLALKEIDKKMNDLAEKQNPIYEEYGKAMEAGEEPSKELQAKMEKSSEQQMELYEQRSEFENVESTGFVWVLIRKPDTAKVSTSLSATQNP